MCNLKSTEISITCIWTLSCHKDGIQCSEIKFWRPEDGICSPETYSQVYSETNCKSLLCTDVFNTVLGVTQNMTPGCLLWLDEWVQICVYAYLCCLVVGRYKNISILYGSPVHLAEKPLRYGWHHCHLLANYSLKSFVRSTVYSQLFGFSQAFRMNDKVLPPTGSWSPCPHLFSTRSRISFHSVQVLRLLGASLNNHKPSLLTDICQSLVVTRKAQIYGRFGVYFVSHRQRDAKKFLIDFWTVMNWARPSLFTGF